MYIPARAERFARSAVLPDTLCMTFLSEAGETEKELIALLIINAPQRKNQAILAWRYIFIFV